MDSLALGPMSTTLRAATIEDAAAVAEVLLSSRRAFLHYAPPARSQAEIYRWVHEVLIPSGGVTVACEDHAVVAFLAVARESETAWINQLYVAPGCTGRGLGSRLLASALASLARPVRLHTFQANVRARAFYERHGFTVVAFGDGSANEERCPDVLLELRQRA